MTDTLTEVRPSAAPSDDGGVRQRVAPLPAQVAEDALRRELDGGLPRDAVRRLARAGLGASDASRARARPGLAPSVQGLTCHRSGQLRG